MKDSKTIDRRTLLSSTLGWAALALSGCSDGGGGGTDGSGGTGTGTGGKGGSGTGGMAGSGSGGMAGTGGTGASPYACTDTMTGTHMHPLTIPGSDVYRGFQDAPYLLEDGGNGHTHNLELTAYDYAYLQAGVTRMVDSTTTNNHLHTVSITCVATS